LVLESIKKLALREIEISERLGPEDVRISISSVGICGSDVHYYQFGSIGDFVVREPMVLGHEASGIIVEVGEKVAGLKPGDRVCMEPGIPDMSSRASRLGFYNLDPAVRFWGTPPVHGCLRPTVVHPAAFTYLLPHDVSFDEGAMVEPLAIGMHAATKAAIKPGDIAVVIGAGTIGAMTTMAALAGGCSLVIVSDVKKAKLDLLSPLGNIMTVDATKEDLQDVIQQQTGSWGADIVFETSGDQAVGAKVFELLCPGGRVVYISMPTDMVMINIPTAQIREAKMETIFRYANAFPRALALMGSGKIDLKPFITDHFNFADSIQAFNYASDMKPSSVKVMIHMGN